MVYVFFDIANKSILNMDNLIGFISHTTFMSYHQDGLTLFLMQLFEQLHDFNARLGVKGSGRFIR